MKKRGAWILSAWLGLSGHASAENKLFITDVLDRGQFEAEATLRFTKSSQDDLSFPSGSIGTTSRDTSRLVTSFGMGVIDGFQIDATVPYAFVDTQWSAVNGVTRDTDRSGVGDLDVGFKFRLPARRGAPRSRAF